MKKCLFILTLYAAISFFSIIAQDANDIQVIEEQMKARLKILSEGINTYLDNLKQKLKEQDVESAEDAYQELTGYVMRPNMTTVEGMTNGVAGYITPVLNDIGPSLKIINELNPAITNTLILSFEHAAKQLEQGLAPDALKLIAASKAMILSLQGFRVRRNFEPPYFIALLGNLIYQFQRQNLALHSKEAKALANSLKSAAKKLSMRLYEIENEIPVKDYPYPAMIESIWKRAHITAYPVPSPQGPTTLWYSDRIITE